MECAGFALSEAEKINAGFRDTTQSQDPEFVVSDGSTELYAEALHRIERKLTLLLCLQGRMTLGELWAMEQSIDDDNEASLQQQIERLKKAEDDEP